MDKNLSLREAAVARLTEDFGSPMTVGDGYIWTIELQAGKPSITVSLNGWLTPTSVRLWVFDRRKPGAQGAHHIDVNQLSELEPAIEELQCRIHGREFAGHMRSKTIAEDAL
jgi:hypothetical protein